MGLSGRSIRSSPDSRQHTLEKDFPVVKGDPMTSVVFELWTEDIGQDIAEYAVVLAVILVLVDGTIRLIGTSANNVFSATASSIGQ